MKILMVCLGNICRSPLAQGILEKQVKMHKLDWEIDSAGTGSWHAGENPDPRAIRTGRNRGYEIAHQQARQIRKSDFENFDLILTMDTENYNNVIALCPEALRQKVYSILSFSQVNPFASVPDPYYDNRFDEVIDLLEEVCPQIILKYLK